jgi:two-component system, NtrC family, response regulator HydG
MMSKIFIVDDDIIFARMLENYLIKRGYQVVARYSYFEGIKGVDELNFDLALLDYKFLNGTGIDILMKIKESKPEVPVIMMTSLNEVRLAVRVMKSGAFEYITKPINHEELLLVLNEALNSLSNQSSANDISPNSSSFQLDFFLTPSKVSQNLMELIDLVSPTPMTVLLNGESGTGKEYVARLIHKSSTRKNHPFIAIDCGTLTTELAGSELFGHVKGAFTGAVENKIGAIQRADKGTLFLDEIGNLNYDVQIKLLRFLQERNLNPLGSEKTINVDIRLILATNENLDQAISKGEFRSDLYHRINEFPINLPTLRDRKEDLVFFCKHFLNLSNKELNKNVININSEVMEALKAYHWPGNLRELKNVIKRAVLLCKTDELCANNFPYDLIHGLYEKPEDFDNLKDLHNSQEKELILKVLKDNNFNKSKTADALKIDRKTLYNKLDLHNINFKK